MAKTSPVNREFKDRLFKFIFGNPEHKDWTLELLNAFLGTDYVNSDDIEFTTIEDAVYMGMKNDVSFLFYGMMSFFEQQSNFDRDVPFRFLCYTTMVYNNHEKTTKSFTRNEFGQRELPFPICVCFYNGLTDKEDRIELKLSDCFKKVPRLEIEPSIEVKVTMMNINYGRNKELLAKCKPLSDYSWFVAQVRLNLKTMALEEAIDVALRDMPDDSILKPFLMANKAEVKNMWITEYDQERAFEDQWAAGRAEGEVIGEARGIKKGEVIGEKRGEEKGTFKTLLRLLSRGQLTLEEAASDAGLSEEEFLEQTKRLS